MSVLSSFSTETERLSQFNAAPRQSLRETAEGLGPLVGRSEPMRSLYSLIRQVGPSAASVLVIGRSGTGKELVARALHNFSPRRDKPFIAVNCAAIPETLIEGELFGHEKGAFTGASQKRIGYFELANHGTLFLDELSSMPAASRVKLLRVIEGNSFRRLRGSQEIRANVRIVAAMGSDPADAIREGKLRPDLYYRLNVFTLELPCLKDRLTDVPLLAKHFTRQFNRDNGKSVAGLSGEALRALLEYSWPGNVRELRNAIERAVILAEEDQIRLCDLPSSIAKGQEAGSAKGQEAGLPRPENPLESSSPFEVVDDSDGSDEGLVSFRVGVSLEDAKRELILRTLEATGNNKSHAARILGISSKTIYNKVREWEGESLSA